MERRQSGVTAVPILPPLGPALVAELNNLFAVLGVSTPGRAHR